MSTNTLAEEAAITVTEHQLESGGTLTVLESDGTVVRIVPDTRGQLVAYIGNGYVDAAGIDTLIRVLEAAKAVMG